MGGDFVSPPLTDCNWYGIMYYNEQGGQMKVNPQFEKYLGHLGHNIVVAAYGEKDKNGCMRTEDVENVSIECETCCCVLTDENKYGEDQNDKPIQTIKAGKTLIEIHQDTDPSNPREDSNVDKMFCLHRRYRLPNEAPLVEIFSDSNWDTIRASIERTYAPVVILPIYMYDHGGITIATKPFACPWDSGQIGFIFATEKDVKDNFGTSEIMPKTVEAVTRLLESEVEVYNRFLCGEAYGYVIKTECPHCGQYDTQDSCWGYDSIESAIEAGKGAIK